MSNLAFHSSRFSGAVHAVMGGGGIVVAIAIAMNVRGASVWFALLWGAGGMILGRKGLQALLTSKPRFELTPAGIVTEDWSIAWDRIDHIQIKEGGIPIRLNVGVVSADGDCRWLDFSELDRRPRVALREFADYAQSFRGDLMSITL